MLQTSASPALHPGLQCSVLRMPLQPQVGCGRLAGQQNLDRPRPLHCRASPITSSFRAPSPVRGTTTKSIGHLSSQLDQRHVLSIVMALSLRARSSAGMATHLAKSTPNSKIYKTGVNIVMWCFEKKQRRSLTFKYLRPCTPTQKVLSTSEERRPHCAVTPSLYDFLRRMFLSSPVVHSACVAEHCSCEVSIRKAKIILCSYCNCDEGRGFRDQEKRAPFRHTSP